VDRDTRPSPLPFVLGVTLVTLALGWLLKSPCLGPWDDGRQYTRLCYSDVAALYSAEGIDQHLVPYFEHTNEYPVLTGFTMALTGIPARSYASFFNWNALLLGGFALVTSWALSRMAGERALLFAAAPTLLIYSFVNWDLIPVALATLATFAFLRKRDGPAGILLGLGAAAKLYPALLLAPFALQRLRERRPERAGLLVGAGFLTWLAVNLPVALFAPDGRWSEFFRFNTERPADWDSLWLLTQRHLGFPDTTAAVNLLSAIAFVALSTVLLLVAWRRRPDFPLWTFGFPLIVAFLLTGKVYSPQFSLWLLPWFALVLPDLRLFVAFSAAEVAVFVTRFQYFAQLDGYGGLPLGAFELALLARAAVLIAALLLWVRRFAQPAEPRQQQTPEPAAEAIA